MRCGVFVLWSSYILLELWSCPFFILLPIPSFLFFCISGPQLRPPFQDVFLPCPIRNTSSLGSEPLELRHALFESLSLLIQVPEHTLLLILSWTIFCLLWPLAIIPLLSIQLKLFLFFSLIMQSSFHTHKLCAAFPDHCKNICGLWPGVICHTIINLAS